MMETQLPAIRIHAFTKTVPAERGYIGTDVVHLQQLQVQTPSGWVVVDQEEIPSHVKISMGCFGDTGGWISKFASLGEFGADGIIHRKS